MKTTFFFLSLLYSIALTAQYQSAVLNVAQQMPEFPGGEDSMWHFISEHTHYPDSAAAHNVQGKVIMGFVVNGDGSLSDIAIKKGLTADIDTESMRVVRSFPRFKPGMQDGKTVRVNFMVPLTFKLMAAQRDTTKKMIEIMPQYPGGEQAMMHFIQLNMKYPVSCMENDIQGRVVVAYVVNEDGSLSDFRITHSVHPLLDAEAVRLVKSMPKFIPGTQQGKPVKVNFVLPIMFKLTSG